MEYNLTSVIIFPFMPENKQKIYTILGVRELTILIE